MQMSLTKVLAAATCVLLPTASMAEPAAEFYKGKQVNFIVSFGVGGGYDLYSRVVARHIGRLIPGKPNVVVQNMPGAGSIRGANHLYNIAPRDGTVLGMVDQALPLTQVLEPGSFKGDVTKFNWIGRISSNEAVLYGWHTAPVQKISDAFEKELIISATGRNSIMLSTFTKNLLGLKFKIMTGYKGSGQSRLAMERGEVHALTQPWPALKAGNPEWLRDKKVNLLLQVGIDSHDELKSVPVILDLARNADERKLIEVMAGGSRIGRSVTSPPAQPAERVKDLRNAFMATVKDPEFLAEVKKTDLDLNPLSGEELQKAIASAVDIPPALAERARKLAEIDSPKEAEKK